MVEEKIPEASGMGESQKLMEWEVGTYVGYIWEGFLEGAVPLRRSWQSQSGFAKKGNEAQLGGSCVCWAWGWGQQESSLIHH